MNITVMSAAQRHYEFVADLAAQRTRLHEAEVMGIRWRSPAHETGLLHDEPEMLLVAIATRLGDREDTLVNTARPANARRSPTRSPPLLRKRRVAMRQKVRAFGIRRI